MQAIHGTNMDEQTFSMYEEIGILFFVKTRHKTLHSLQSDTIFVRKMGTKSYNVFEE